MELLKGVCNILEMCNQKSECYHSKLHEYMTATCREGYCSMSGRICKCYVKQFTNYNNSQNNII